MKTPHLFDTSFLFNMQCALQSISEASDFSSAEKEHFHAVMRDLSDNTNLQASSFDKHFQTFRKLSWEARSTAAKKQPALDAAVMLIDSIRCVLSSKAAQGKREEVDVDVEN